MLHSFASQTFVARSARASRCGVSDAGRQPFSRPSTRPSSRPSSRCAVVPLARLRRVHLRLLLLRLLRRHHAVHLLLLLLRRARLLLLWRGHGVGGEHYGLGRACGCLR